MKDFRDLLQRRLESSGVIFQLSRVLNRPVELLYQDLLVKNHTSLWLEADPDRVRLYFTLNLSNPYWTLAAGN